MTIIDNVKAMISTRKEMKRLFEHLCSQGGEYAVEETMDINSVLLTIKDADIDWESLKPLSEETLKQVQNRIGTCLFIRQSKDGCAEVIWELIPPGEYCWDDRMECEYILNGIGLNGIIDSQGYVLKKFHYESLSIGYKDEKEDDDEIE